MFSITFVYIITIQLCRPKQNGVLINYSYLITNLSSLSRFQLLFYITFIFPIAYKKISVMLASPVCINTMNIKSKEKQLKTVWDLTKIKTIPDDGRKYLIIQRKSISSSTYEGLIDKLYDYFFGDNAATMYTYLETWMEWREKETSVSKKTIKENQFMWSSLLKDQDITLIPLKDLSAKDLIIYFRNITKGR